MKNRLAVFLAMAIGAHAAVIAADSARGGKLFETLACVQCHSVNGNGAQIGPDLGRLVDRNFTPASLAATMWNHAPTMWTAMRDRKIRAGDLDEQAAADLFAYFYSTRFFEKQGDAARGKRVLDQGCGRCHGLNASTLPGAPPVSQWRSVNSPFELTEAMRNHLPRMQAAAGAKGIPLPQLSAQDLVDVLVYVRNLPAMRGQTGSFDTTSGTNGAAIFQAKGCIGCHKDGSALAARIKGSTLTEIAASMWNHAPRMSAAGAPPVHFEPGEMRELLSYLWVKQFFESGGNGARGKRVFASKHCAACHDSRSAGAPDLRAQKSLFSAASLVAALWKHGPTMQELMRTKQIAWPRFDAHEMSDLIGYLNSQDSAK